MSVQILILLMLISVKTSWEHWDGEVRPVHSGHDCLQGRVCTMDADCLGLNPGFAMCDPG